MKSPDHQNHWFDLFSAAANGNIEAQQNEDLQHLLKTNPEARRLWYLYNDLETGLAEWAAQRSQSKTNAPEVSAPSRRPLTWRKPLLVILSTAAVITIALTYFHQPPTTSDVRLAILESSTPSLSGSPVAWNPGDKVTASSLDLTSGSLRFSPSEGNIVTANPPVSIEFVNPTHLRVLHGKLTAEATPGFTIETNHARLVDLGTQFGVEVIPGGDTNLVVFDGEVEVHQATSSKKPPLATIIEGHAIGIGEEGRISEIASILTSGTIDGWSIATPSDETSIISAVHDNVPSKRGNRYYPIFAGGLAEGVRAFPYQKNTPRWWSTSSDGLPANLRGADFIQTLQRELDNPDLEITVTLAKPCDLFIFHESMTEPPDWLKSEFTRTGVRLALSPEPPPADLSPDRPILHLRHYDVWQKRIETPGNVTLGSISRSDQTKPPHYMYGIAAKEIQARTSR